MQHSTEAYISGAICGHTWMPQAMGGLPYKQDFRGMWGLLNRFTEPSSFRDALLSALMEHGGDFQDAEFTADTEIVILHRYAEKNGYRVRVKTLTLDQVDCGDLVNNDHEAFEFFGD